MKKGFLSVVLMTLVCLKFIAQTIPTLSVIATPNSKVGWIYFKNPSAINPNTLFTVYSSNFGLGPDDQMVLLKQETDNLNMSHTSYQQYYKNHKVEGGQFIIHSHDSSSLLANGHICHNLNISTNAQINAPAAISYAITYFNATTYLWQDSIAETVLKQKNNDVNATYFPTPELLITMDGADLPFTNSNFKLAYKIDIFAKTPYLAKTIYIDANTGGFIKEVSLNYTCGPSINSPPTLFSGNQTLVTNYTLNSANGLMEHQLHNSCKGGGIQTNYVVSGIARKKWTKII